MFLNEDFSDNYNGAIPPPNIFDSPVVQHRHSHHSHQSMPQVLLAHEKTISNDGKASNHSNHLEEFPFRRKMHQDLSAGIFPLSTLVRLDSNGPQQSDEGTNYSPKLNPIYSSANKIRMIQRERHHDSSSDEDFDGNDSEHELDDFEHHNLISGQIHLADYDSDYAEDERMMQKWQARRLGLVYLGREELEKHAEKCQLSEEERIHYLLGK